MIFPAHSMNKCRCVAPSKFRLRNKKQLAHEHACNSIPEFLDQNGSGVSQLNHPGLPLKPFTAALSPQTLYCRPFPSNPLLPPFSLKPFNAALFNLLLLLFSRFNSRDIPDCQHARRPSFDNQVSCSLHAVPLASFSLLAERMRELPVKVGSKMFSTKSLRAINKNDFSKIAS